MSYPAGVKEIDRRTHIEPVRLSDGLANNFEAEKDIVQKVYTSSVWFWKIRLNVFEQFTMTNIEDAKKSSDLVLKQVASWLRPFCRVEWN